MFGTLKGVTIVAGTVLVTGVVPGSAVVELVIVVVKQGVDQVVADVCIYTSI